MRVGDERRRCPSTTPSAIARRLETELLVELRRPGPAWASRATPVPGPASAACRCRPVRSESARPAASRLRARALERVVGQRREHLAGQPLVEEGLRADRSRCVAASASSLRRRASRSIGVLDAARGAQQHQACDARGVAQREVQRDARPEGVAAEGEGSSGRTSASRSAVSSSDARIAAFSPCPGRSRVRSSFVPARMERNRCAESLVCVNPWSHTRGGPEP